MELREFEFQEWITHN